MTLFAASSPMPDPLTLNLADAAIKLGALLVIYLCFIVAQRFLSRKQLFRGIELQLNLLVLVSLALLFLGPILDQMHKYVRDAFRAAAVFLRSEEHTSELQSRQYLGC